MALVSSQDFHENNGIVVIDGEIYEFLTYKEYLEYMEE